MKKPSHEEENRNIILDSIADGVFTVDEDWRITSFNRAAERITGVPREQAVGRLCRDIFHSSICETECALERTMRTGRPIIDLSMDIQDAAGRRVPISISTAILSDADGRVMGGVETFRDLSVVENVILDSIADGVFTVDKDWRITSFNRAAERITGVPREQAVGRPCREIFHSSICETECALGKTMRTGCPIVDLALDIQNAAGRRIPISISTAILSDEDGNVTGGVETFRDLSVVEELRKELQDKYTVEDIVGRSPAMRRLFDVLPQFAQSNSTVLLEGESGTGKELFARAIHNLSDRRNKPFVAINCGALPDTLLESELFGYEAGAFTDARRRKLGRFSLAHGGTIFLDEIGDISAAMQTRLLRALQEGTFEPLGSEKTLTVDMRVIAATNKNLAKLVRKGIFREDLYYRINVIRVELPALRERREDIPLLVDHFLAKFNRLQNKNVTGVSGETNAVLIAYDYPGNIRELSNIIEHAFVLCQGGLINAQHLPSPPGNGSAAEKSERPTSATMRDFETVHIADVVRRCDGNRVAAAQALNMHPSTLYRKVKQLGIELPTKDGRSKKAR